jgi:hypothetical protein
LKMMKVQAGEHQQNHRKCWRNSRIHPRRPSPNYPWACRQCWDQLWSLPGDLTENLNMCHIAASSRRHARPQVPENHSVCD